MRLYNDSMLEVKYRIKLEEHQPGGVTTVVSREEVVRIDLHKQDCSVVIVPDEVASNRKRRWSKKFPIALMWRDGREKRRLFLFTPTSRDKEEWFRRMRYAVEGVTYDKLVEKLELFYRYMGKYMPVIDKPQSQSFRSRSQYRPQNQPQSYSSVSHGGGTAQRATGGRGGGGGGGSGHGGAVSFSTHTEEEDGGGGESYSSTSVKISKKSPSQQRAIAVSKKGEGRGGGGGGRRVSGAGAGVSTNPPPLLGWITAGMARLVWDAWHEDRWRNWATTRIQRKLIRVKTPWFIDPLKVTEVNMGMDMPVIRRSHRSPVVDNRGVWVYLEVEYHGSFTMTIETKLKLHAGQKKGEDIHYSTATTLEEPPRSSRSPSPSPSPPSASSPVHSSTEHRSSFRHHSRIAPLVSTRLTGSKFPSEQDEEISSGSDDESLTSSMSSASSMEDKIPAELETQVGGLIESSQAVHEHVRLPATLQ